MTCKHQPGDPNCSSTSPEQRRRFYKERLKELPLDPTPATPDAANYTIEEMERIGPHVVLRVQYPNCKKCAYEGNKVMVFLDVTEKDLLRWRIIDPHFRAPPIPPEDKTQAPSPAARFPASIDGWADAIIYASGKVKKGAP